MPKTLLLSLLAIFMLTSCDDIGDVGQKISNRGDNKTEWWSELPRESWSQFPSVARHETWFEVYRVQPHILAIYEPGQFEEVISYLVLGSERALLIDSGLGVGNLRDLVKTLTDLPVAVINTHTHYDHIGGNYQFDEVFGRSTAFTRINAAGKTHEQMAEYVGPAWIWKTTPTEFDAKRYVSRKFTITQQLTDGQLIDLGDRELQVLFTDGHTPDALCVLDQAAGVLFTGDTFYLAPLYTHLEGGEFALFHESINKLARLQGLKVLMPGHNETGISAQYLQQARDAFAKVAANDHPFKVTDNNREYDFGDFSIITKDDVAKGVSAEP